ncbi:hypothetical protein I542_3045 [Mycobacteroides abscessus 1948]|uniref:Uncharacterized protein n=1 Tax=Mycobacteroides abscessus 1948 TaxID=1299323 RepID=A0A829QJW1_9MYCO|nr:hypothetical protein I542_3045 [Mycobacteroides abscessus 1948]
MNQIETPASTVTSPMRQAVGATNASGWTLGLFPSSEYKGIEIP